MEFDYFLGQTMPFHQTESHDNIPVSHLAYIMDANGKPHPWTTDTKVLMNFVLIGNKLGVIPLQKNNNQLTFTKSPSIKPITHRERTHTDD